jgi:ribosomal protein L11 methyltransferase
MLEGLHPNHPTHVMRLTTNEASARAMTDLLGEIFDPAETAVAAFEAEDERTWLLEAYFARAPDEAAIRDLIRPIVGAQAEDAAFERLEQKDWVKASLEGLKPVRAGRFLVHGAHDRGAVRPNDWAIEIEAALAFGTGHHGTTKGCLIALTDELRRRRPRRVLDVGTGTGVLAFAAAKALKRQVIAGDIDPTAVAVARANARLNDVAPALRFYVAAGARHPLADRRRSLRQYPGEAVAKAGAVARSCSRERGNADLVGASAPRRGGSACRLCGSGPEAEAAPRHRRLGRAYARTRRFSRTGGCRSGERRAAAYSQSLTKRWRFACSRRSFCASTQTSRRVRRKVRKIIVVLFVMSKKGEESGREGQHRGSDEADSAEFALDERRLGQERSVPAQFALGVVDARCGGQALEEATGGLGFG